MIINFLQILILFALKSFVRLRPLTMIRCNVVKSNRFSDVLYLIKYQAQVRQDVCYQPTSKLMSDFSGNSYFMAWPVAMGEASISDLSKV